MGLGDKALARPASSGRLNGSAACPASALFVCLTDISARFSFGFRGHDPFVLRLPLARLPVVLVFKSGSSCFAHLQTAQVFPSHYREEEALAIPHYLANVNL